jgi:hypothetical protein
MMMSLRKIKKAVVMTKTQITSKSHTTQLPKVEETMLSQAKWVNKQLIRLRCNLLKEEVNLTNPILR